MALNYQNVFKFCEIGYFIINAKILTFLFAVNVDPDNEIMIFLPKEKCVCNGISIFHCR